MKKYDVRLEKILRVRRMQEDAARAAVAQARTAEQSAAEKLEASRRHCEALAAVEPATSISDFLALRDRGGFRAQAVGLAGQRRRSAADQTAGAVNVWHDTHRRVDALERLDERRREDYAIEAQRHEDAVVDEIVTSRARRSA
jgi:flagellar export protein FliJ